MIKCHKCGKPMLWHNDFDLEEWECESVEGIVSFYSCDYCDIHYEITEIYERKGEDK